MPVRSRQSSPDRSILPRTPSGSSFRPPLATRPASGSTSWSDQGYPRGPHLAAGVARQLECSGGTHPGRRSRRPLQDQRGQSGSHSRLTRLCPPWAGPDIADRAKICAGAVDFTVVVIRWRGWVEAWGGEASRVPEADGPNWRARVLRGFVRPPDGSGLG